MTKESDCNKCASIGIQCTNRVVLWPLVLIVKICVIDLLDKILDQWKQDYTVEDYNKMVWW